MQGETNEEAPAANSFMLLAADESMLTCQETQSNHQRWVADTGASHHMTNDESGLYNKVVPTEEKTVNLGNGALVSIEYVAEFRGYYLDKNCC